MTVFDHDSADRARAENPALSIFDTGQALEPELETERWLDTSGVLNMGRTRRTGLVTFTKDESAPVFTVRAQPSVTDDDTTLILIDATAGGRFKIALNDQDVWVGDVDQAIPAAVTGDDLLARATAYGIAAGHDDDSTALAAAAFRDGARFAELAGHVDFKPAGEHESITPA